MPAKFQFVGVMARVSERNSKALGEGDIPIASGAAAARVGVGDSRSPPAAKPLVLV